MPDVVVTARIDKVKTRVTLISGQTQPVLHPPNTFVLKNPDRVRWELRDAKGNPAVLFDGFSVQISFVAFPRQTGSKHEPPLQDNTGPQDVLKPQPNQPVIVARVNPSAVRGPYLYNVELVKGDQKIVLRCFWRMGPTTRLVDTGMGGGHLSPPPPPQPPPSK